MTLQTQRAVRYFCYTVGTVALLWLLAVLVIAVVFLKTVATGDSSASLNGITTQSTLTPNGVCSADQVDVDPDC